MTNLQKLMQELFERGTQEDHDGVVRRVTSVHPEADAAFENFEYQMKGTGAISADAQIATKYADCLVGDVQDLVYQALRADAEALPLKSPAGRETDQLPRTFDPQGWQWEHQNRVYQLEDLSRNDLLQVACACMQALENADALSQQLAGVIQSWRKGEAQADENTALTPVDA